MVGAGDRLGSNYVVGHVLGRGSMGVVHEAHALSAGERVAVKILHPHLAAEASIVGRFVQEREVLERIDHSNVVRVRDLVVDLGHVGIVMEHIKGCDLKTVLSKRSLTASEALELGRQLAGGLHEIHAAGVVHRDLKPGNVLIASDENLVPKITDFGISHLADQNDVVKAFAGTPRYMAPEAMAEGATVGPAFDVYTLGLVLYEMLVGARPFIVEGSLAAMHAHREEPPPGVGGVPPALAELIDRMLAKRPADRPTSDEVSDCLATLVAEVDPDERPYRIEPTAPAERPVRLFVVPEPASADDPDDDHQRDGGPETDDDERRQSANGNDGEAEADASGDRLPRHVEHGAGDAAIYRFIGSYRYGEEEKPEKPVSTFVALARRQAERKLMGGDLYPDGDAAGPPTRPSTFAALARQEAERRRLHGDETKPFDMTADRPKPLPAPPTSTPSLAPVSWTAATPPPPPPSPMEVAPAAARAEAAPVPDPPAPAPPPPPTGPAPSPPAASAQPARPSSASPSRRANGRRLALTWQPEIEPRRLVIGAAQIAAVAIVGLLIVSLSNRDPGSPIRLLPTSDVDILSSDPEPETASGPAASGTASESTSSESNGSDAVSTGGSATFEVAGPTVNSSRPSIGPSTRTIRVPSLIGRTVAAAEAELEEAGLVIDFAGGAADGGRVVRSEPASEALVEPGATVTVWVGG